MFSRGSIELTLHQGLCVLLLLLDDILQMAISQLQLVQSLLKRWMRGTLKEWIHILY